MKTNSHWPFSKMKISSLQALMLVLVIPMLALHVLMGALTGAWKGWREGIAEIRVGWAESKKSNTHDREDTK